MTPPVFLNGRFLRQTVSGVQRFSAEITRAIDHLIEGAEWPETLVLAPPPHAARPAMRSAIRTAARPFAGEAPFRQLRLHQVGRTQGHLWEQTVLPGAARGGVLLNLGNTAPILAGRRQVVVIHDAGVFDTPESYSLSFRTWYKALQNALIRTGAQIATVSEFSRDRIVARLGIDPERVTVTYEGADHILRVPADNGALARHGLTTGRYALVVGSRVAHKNVAGLHEAAAALERRGMMIAMTGSVNPDVFRRIADVSFAGRRLGRVNDSELRALYENAACLLFPSRYEGFGLPPVEAMACACPVIAAEGGAVQEICRDSALYFNTQQPSSVSAAVQRLLDDEGLAEVMRRRGLARAAELSWEASARTLRRLIVRAY